MRYMCVCSCFLAYLITYMCHVVYMCWCLCLCYVMMVLESVCVPVGVEWEPQFLYGPICFVLFVLLINEIRGAACWDGPRCTATLDRPTFSWADSVFQMNAFSFSLCFLIVKLFLSLSLSVFINLDLMFYFLFLFYSLGGHAGPREVTIGRRLV